MCYSSSTKTGSINNLIIILMNKYFINKKKSIISDDKIDINSFKFRLEKFSEIIPKNSIVLDIGAHVGGFSLLFGECVGDDGKVLAFEPNPKTFESLKFKADNNSSLNIIPYNYACVDKQDNFIFNYSDPSFGSSMNGGFFDSLTLGDKIKQFHSHQVKVKGINILEFLETNHANDLDKIKFIKIDTEGFDKEILKTLSPLIISNKPVLMVEAFRGLTKNEILDFWNILKSFNYEIYDVSPLDNKTDCVGPLTLEEFEYYIYKIMDNGNFFCFHKDEVSKYNLPTTIYNKTAVVVFGRNDGYKEKERFIIHLTTMLDTFDEVIYVDWNSPTNSFLYEVIDQIPKTDRLKHFIIPPEYALLMSNNDEKAQICNSVLSFNLGLRRTDAEWVVLSTTDIIPPSREELHKFISQANKNSLYTFSRRDVDYDDVISNSYKLNDYREYLNKTTQPRHFPTKVTPNDNYSIFNCCGDFQLAPKNLWYKIRGYEEPMLYACFADTNVQKKAVLYGFDLVPIYDVPLYHMSHKGMGNDGSSPSKQYYNDAWEWVEFFDKYEDYGHIMFSRNADTWGFSNVEIEFEVI
jgi:FkbM family methyltransferase